MATRAWARTRAGLRNVRGRRSTAATVAGLVFVLAMAVAVPLYLVRGHNQWFFLDEWDFLAARSLTNFDSLLRPHNEHWSTLPIIVYRVLWQLFGLRTYVPYQAILVSLHLTAALLLRRIMRRADVGPWVATAAASLFLFLGSGRQDIVWAFQIGFTGALVCGLAHLILADHDGPPDRRDAIGIALGLAGLMCSGVGVTMTIIVGLSVLIRRGWRAAAVNTVPLALVYGIWYQVYGRDAYQAARSSLDEIRRFVTAGLENAFSKMGQVPRVGTALAIILIAGLVVAWSRMPLDQLRRRAAVPAALLLGAVVFLAIAGWGRAFLGTEPATESRIVHLVVAMTLPAIAVAADALARRWRPLLPLVVVLLLAGVPGNIDEISAKGSERYTLGNRSQMLELAWSPLARRVPRSLHPDPGVAAEVTVGWLLDGARSGRIPHPKSEAPAAAANAALFLQLRQTTRTVPTGDCVAVVKPVRLLVRRGDVLAFREGLPVVQLLLADGRASPPRAFQPSGGTTVHVEAGPATLIVSRAPGTRRLVLCRVPGASDPGRP